MTAPPAHNRRADARRSRAAILDAAVRVLDAQPDAALTAVASAAGLTRQTVYAHFPSREHLLWAVVERRTEDVVAAMDAVDIDAGPAPDAMLRLLDAAEREARRHPTLAEKLSKLPADPHTDRDLHAPVADRIRRVIQRGRDTGEFDIALPVDWLVTATIRLAHTASEEQTSGRMSVEDAAHALRASLLRLLGADEHLEGA